MKSLFTLVLLSFFGSAHALQLDVRSYNFFGDAPYTEIYLRITGQSITWKNNSASVQLLLLVKDKSENIAAYDKITLTLEKKDSIVDLLEVKRFKLLPETYIIRLEAIDLNKEANKMEIEQKLIVPLANASYKLSDLLPLALVKNDSTEGNFTKSGLYLEPLPFHFADKTRKQLDIYLESYKNMGTDANELFIQYSVKEGFISKAAEKPLFSKFKKLQNLPTEAHLISLPIHAIKSGEYYVEVNIIDKQKNVLATSKGDFVKDNPEIDIAFFEAYNDTPEHAFVQEIQPEDMDYVLKAHLPITEQHQVGVLGELIRSNKIKSQRQFIFQLWKKRSPTSPDKAYKMYMDVAAAVEKKFHTNVGYGFQSDRGHIFLKYGKPSNVMTVDNEVDAPPYEIWYYNQMPSTTQTNVRFLFYNPTLAHNDFRLLHSTCLGERVNLAWETELYKSVPMERQGNTIDATTVGENWNRNARRFFNEY